MTGTKFRRTLVYPTCGAMVQPFPKGWRRIPRALNTSSSEGCPANVRTKLGDDWELQRPERSCTGGFPGAKPCLKTVWSLRTREAASGLWRAKARASGPQTTVKSVDCRILGLTVGVRVGGEGMVA